MTGTDKSRLLAPLTLFLLAPPGGEFLLDNLSITSLRVPRALAPLYGAGALLIREFSLRVKAGWRGRVPLGFVLVRRRS